MLWSLWSPPVCSDLPLSILEIDKSVFKDGLMGAALNPEVWEDSIPPAIPSKLLLWRRLGGHGGQMGSSLSLKSVSLSGGFAAYMEPRKLSKTQALGSLWLTKHFLICRCRYMSRDSKMPLDPLNHVSTQPWFLRTVYNHGRKSFSRCSVFLSEIPRSAAMVPYA